MKIAFNPSTVAALTTPPNNKDITFDLRGRNIFARGVKFYGTDTNTWRDIKINNVSIGSNILDLRNGSNTTLTNTNGVVTINSTWRPVVDNLTSDSTTSSLSAKQGKVLKALIDGKSNSDHNHDGRYLKLTGGTMASNAMITFADSGSWGTDKGPQGARGGLYWTGQSDYAKLYAEETVGNNLDLVIQFGDDNSNGLSIRNKANTQTSYISSSGVITTGTFKGNLDWSYITNKPLSYTPSAHTHAWNSLTHSSTTENQAILTNGKANGWKLQTLNIARWDNAANNAHSHANKSVLDGITSALVNSWNTAYNFVSNITGTDTDKVINKWEEIVNFLAGITEDNKLNTLLNNKLSIQQLSAKDILTTKTNNALFWVDTKGNASTITTGPFTDHPYALLSVTNYNQNAENHKFFYRSRLAFSSAGDIKVASCHHEYEYQQDETWYNILTSKNSGINGSTIKLNGTSITVYSSGTADGRYVKKSGDTMSGVLTIDTTNFGALTIKRNDDAYGASIQFRGKSSVYGYIGLNNSTKDKQFLRWSSDTSRVYTILDTSSTYISNGKGVINGTTITQVDNATNSTNSTNARKLVNWYSARPTSLNAQFGDGSLRIFYATSSTTEGKSPDDAAVLHLAWDNNSGWDSQLAISNSQNRVYSRSQNAGTWQPWKTLAFTTDIPSALKNPYSFNVFGVVYDGSAAKTVTTSTFVSQLPEGASTVTDGTMFITSWASNSGFADTNAVNVPYKRKAIHLWEYIKAKTDSLYATKGHNHDGIYVRAFRTSNDNIDSDWGQSFKTFDPVPLGTPPENNPNISLLSIGENFNRRKQLAFIWNNDNIYYRRRIDSSFTNWRRLAFVDQIPTSLKNPHALTISLNGTSQGPYDGSAAKNINITPGSIGAATSNHNHDGRYVYNYGGTQMNGASIDKNALGMTTTSGISGDWWHILQAAWNGEYRWNSQIAFPTQNRNGMYYRSGLDDNTKWGSWVKLLDVNNYSSTLDSRYYTESEVNSLLDAKLNRQNLSYGTWNPRGYHLAADYHYNGGDLSISENNGKMYVSVDGCFWQNEGQYRVLDTSDIGDIRNSVTLHQYLGATDAAWYPLVWGGASHNNTSDSTGPIYKSYDKLSWQTSSQTLYATNIQTNNIKNLSIGGGIYWNPNVESASNGSDAASITLVRQGVAGGTTLVLSQMNDTNDTIQFKTNTAARLYHNSYPILTTQNTYVSNNKGYINGTEITQVNNSDTVDGWHKDEINRTLYITSDTAGLSSYWAKLWEINLNNQYNDVTITFLAAASYYPSYFSIFSVYLRQNGSGTSKNISARLVELIGNIAIGDTDLRLYVNNTTGNCQLWGNVRGQYGTLNLSVLKKAWRIETDSPNIGTFFYTNFNSVQPLPGDGWSKIGVTQLLSTGVFNPAVHTHTVFKNNLMIKGTNGISDSASIHLGIGDSDTGFKWISDGVCQIYANNEAVGQWTSGGMNWFKNPTVNGNKVWNAGNDGSGSGLDADTLDGLHSTSFAPYNGVKFGHNPDANIWHRILQFTTNWVGQVTFMYSPEECQRSYWGIFNINIRSKDIWFRGFSFADLPQIKCCGDDNNNWSVWIKGNANQYDPYGVIQILNFSNASIVSVGLNKSQTTEPSGTYNKAPDLFQAGSVNWSDITNKIVAGNEFNVVNAGYNNQFWFNYLPINDRNNIATISTYCMGNGKKNLASVTASGFIKNGGNENQLLRADGEVAAFNWAGQSGQPTWLWGGNDFNSYYVYNPSNFRVAYASSAGNADTVDGYHATDGRTFNGDIHWGSWNDTWSDGTHTHPWYGFDHRYPNTGTNSTTISDYFGMTIKTYNTLLLDCGTLLLNSRDNVGIGTTSPTQKLDVHGNIRATGQLYLPTNGNYNAILMGDDCWMGDCNISNVIGLSGTNNANSGGIKFGKGGMYIGYNGSSHYSSGTSLWTNFNADTVDGEHASNFSYTHQTSFDFSKGKSGRIVTFDQSNTNYGWINGFASTHNNYLTSVIFNTHRTSNWYVGYMEGNGSTGKTNGLQAVHKLAFADGDENYPIFLGYLHLYNGNDGTISGSFPCLGYSVPFTYTRGGAYCLINIPNTSFQTFYIKAAIASVHYSGAGMGHWVGNHRGDGAWWLHCDAVGSNAVQVKGFHLANENNDSWWGGNPLYSGDGAAKIITVCLFGYVKFR